MDALFNRDMGYSCASPVLFLIYRRPEHTARVLAALREVRPKCVLIAADGAKIGDDEGQSLVAKTRAVVDAGIDWPCEVKSRYLAAHAGCRVAVSGAIDWAFGEVERLIILEDDCLPGPDFFRFCDLMLEKYAGDPRVMQVCGTHCHDWESSGEAYFFSRFGPIWGWATWRRAWQAYDVGMSSWSEIRASGKWKEFCPEPFESAWRRRLFDAVAWGGLDTWDYQWAYAKLLAGGLNVIPRENLISNIGFGREATHTLNANDPRADLPLGGLGWPLISPGEVATCKAADRRYLNRVVGLPSSRFSPTVPLWWLRQVLQSR